MSKRRKAMTKVRRASVDVGYDDVLAGIVDLLELARRRSARAVNAVMTATYWEIGRRIVEYEQGGAKRAEYGEMLMKRLAKDLTLRFPRGFGLSNLKQMRKFFLTFPPEGKGQTVSGLLGLPGDHGKGQTSSDLSRLPGSDGSSTSDQPIGTNSDSEGCEARSLGLRTLAARFPLPWSHYVLLLSVKNAEAHTFYETEALRGGWSVRQLDRQISSQFFERTALSRNRAAVLRRERKAAPEDALTAEQEIKDPYVLEFLGLKDEYSENELEESLIRQLEGFLLELGGDFAFVGRQRRLRIDDEWYRVDLLFFHRRLRCLVVIDLKLGRLTHADAGQMHMYLNYAREHWTQPGENPPVGLILCAQKGAAMARYALDGLPNKVMAAEYRTALPDVKLLAAQIDKTRRAIERRAGMATRSRARR